MRRQPISRLLTYRRFAVAVGLCFGALACDDSVEQVERLQTLYPQLDTGAASGTGSCLPLDSDEGFTPSDEGFTMVVSQSYYTEKPDLPPGIIIDEMIATTQPGITATAVQIPFDLDRGGPPAGSASLEDPRWDYVEPVPLPYDPSEGEGFALGAVVEIPPDGPIDEQQPVITITGFRFEVDGVEGVMPTRMIAYLSSNPMGDDDFCPQLGEGFDEMPIPD